MQQAGHVAERTVELPNWPAQTPDEWMLDGQGQHVGAPEGVHAEALGGHERGGGAPVVHAVVGEGAVVVHAGSVSDRLQIGQAVGQLVDEQATAGSQYAVELPQRVLGPLDVLEHAAGENRVEVVLGKRQGHGISAHVRLDVGEVLQLHHRGSLPSAVVERTDLHATLAQQVADLAVAAAPVEHAPGLLAGDAIDDRRVLAHLRTGAEVDVDLLGG